MDEIFSSFNEQLEADAAIRTSIKEVVSKINVIVRATEFLVQKAQAKPRSAEDAAATFEAVTAKLAEAQPLWTEVVRLVGDEHQEKYRDQWKGTLTNFVSSLGFAYFLRSHCLITMAECNRLMFGEEDGALSVDLEDYLNGVCSMPTDLARLCVNAVTHRNYELPHVISTFVSDLYSGFRLLNLKNDALRRKFDKIKYSVQSIEQVLYDVQVRNLASSGDKESGEEAPSAMSDE